MNDNEELDDLEPINLTHTPQAIKAVEEEKEEEILLEKEKELSSPDYVLRILFICIICAVIFGALINIFVVSHTTVHGESMKYTLRDNEIVLIDKISYDFNKPKRYDIVLFKTISKEYYIKRIIGLPGETISIKEGIIYINDKPLDEYYGLEKILDAGIAENEITLSDDEYFVLGDNRNNSIDSRDTSVGIINSDSIVGKAFYKIFPFVQFGKIDNDTNIDLNSMDKENE